jgi:hypothetical protein
MYELKALGITASIVRMASLGTKISATLFSLHKDFKNVNGSTSFLSSKLAFISAILEKAS